MTGTQNPFALTAAQICEKLGGTLVGDGSRTVSGVNVIERAQAGQLAFVGTTEQLRRCSGSQAEVVIAPQAVSEAATQYAQITFVLTDEPEVAFLKIAQQLNPPRRRSSIGISPLASVAASARIGTRSNIHPNAVVGEDAVIGDHCEIGPGVVIGDGCVLGDNVVLDANVVLYHDVRLGSDIHVQAGTVLGADGFGYRTVNGGHERLPHVGSVEICDDVQIGALSTIDRAKAGDTVIGRGTRIDNQVVVAHNCQIGEHNLLVSQTGIAGSSSTGCYVVCAGQAGIADHVHLGDHAIIGAKAGVHRDMPGGKAYLGAPAEEAATTARMMSALRRLPELRSTIKQMEKQIIQLQAQVTELLSESHEVAGVRKAA